FLIEFYIGGKAGFVEQGFADADILFVGKISQRGDIVADGAVEIELVGFIEMHDGGGGRGHLCTGGHVEDVVEPGGVVAPIRMVTEGLVIDDLAIFGKEDDDGGGVMGGDAGKGDGV